MQGSTLLRKSLADELGSRGYQESKLYSFTSEAVLDYLVLKWSSNIIKSAKDIIDEVFKENANSKYIVESVDLEILLNKYSDGALVDQLKGYVENYYKFSLTLLRRDMVNLDSANSDTAINLFISCLFDYEDLDWDNELESALFQALSSLATSKTEQ